MVVFNSADYSIHRTSNQSYTNTEIARMLDFLGYSVVEFMKKDTSESISEFEGKKDIVPILRSCYNIRCIKYFYSSGTLYKSFFESLYIQDLRKDETTNEYVEDASIPWQQSMSFRGGFDKTALDAILFSDDLKKAMDNNADDDVLKKVLIRESSSSEMIRLPVPSTLTKSELSNLFTLVGYAVEEKKIGGSINIIGEKKGATPESVIAVEYYKDLNYEFGMKYKMPNRIINYTEVFYPSSIFFTGSDTDKTALEYYLTDSGILQLIKENSTVESLYDAVTKYINEKNSEQV